MSIQMAYIEVVQDVELDVDLAIDVRDALGKSLNFTISHSDSERVGIKLDDIIANDKSSDSQVHMDLPDGSTCSVKTDADGRVCVEDFLKLEKWFNGRFIERIRSEI